MSITKVKFNNEQELQDWIENNINLFFGDVIFLPGNFYIYTLNNKKAKPDGFIIDLNNSSWSILETERIEHGVWRHIGEQLMRFIVASKNIKEGDILNPDNITTKRPGSGISPTRWNEIVGTIATKNYNIDDFI